jgi:hypothetical protein
MKVLLALFVTLLLSLSAVGQDDPYGIIDTVRVESVAASPGDRIDVPIYLVNDEALRGLTVPIKFEQQVLTLDTVSFEGSKIEYLSARFSPIDNTEGTVLIAGVVITEDTIPAGTGLLATLVFQVSPDAEIGHTCQFDTVFVPPSGYLLMSTHDFGSVVPAFAPGTIEITDQNLPPVFDDVPALICREGDTISFNVHATDAEGDGVTYSSLKLPSGAVFNEAARSFDWVPLFTGSASSVGSPFVVSFAASDGNSASHLSVKIDVVNRNRAPMLHAPDSIDIVIGDSVNLLVSAEDPDMEAVEVLVDNLPYGADYQRGNPGYIRWKTGLSDSGVFDINVLALDPFEAEDRKTIRLNVHSAALSEFEISEIQVVSGNPGIVDVNLLNRLPVAGMNLLIKYDPSVLTFLSASSEGTRLESWERYIVTNDNYDGLIWLDARTNLPGNDNIPPLDVGDGSAMKLNFYVSSNLAFAGQLVRVEFEFLDTLSLLDNTLLTPEDDLIGRDEIDYANGAIFIKQVEALIGDINLNGMPFEVGDVVYFTNFFIDPFAYPLDGDRWPNSDINQDNRPGTIGDLILLESIVSGDGYCKITAAREHVRTVEVATRSVAGGAEVVGRCDVAIGGALFVISNGDDTDVEPVLAAANANADLYWAAVGGQLRVLVISKDRKGIMANGDPLLTVRHSGDADLSIDEAQFADTHGAMLGTILGKSAELPTSFDLGQNFPNPFNPTTTISFSLPEAGDVLLKIYNIRGQLVRTLIDKRTPAGYHEVTWDGRNQSDRAAASGVYFYRLETQDFSKTRKMMLIK